MHTFEGDKESRTIESKPQTLEEAHAAALAAANGIPDLVEAEGILHGLASVFFPADSASANGVSMSARASNEATEPPNLEARYRTLVEQIPAVVFMAFLDKGIGEAYVSPQIESVLGFTQEEWLNDPVLWYQQVHPDDKARWSIEAAHMFLSGEPLQSIYRVMARDGHVVWFQCEAKMVRRDDGRPWFIHGVGFDITNLKCAEEALRKAHDELEMRVAERTRELAGANTELQLEIAERRRAEQERAELLAREQAARQQAEEANRLKDEFLATISHELRTPMTAVVGWTHLLRKGMLNERNAEHALETIERNARSQTQLIDDLLDISRIITGKIRLDIRQIELAQVVEAAIDAVRPTAQARRIDLETSIAPEANLARVDPVRLQQVVWNLLSNAIKFTPQGGRVSVKLERVDSQAQMTITDTGEGISPEFLPFVFERFRQADGSITRTHGGLGLGLAIVRNLVELHGGTVAAESRGAGQGAKFTVSLPLLRRREVDCSMLQERKTDAPQPAIRNPHSAILKGLRVLIVEDEVDSRELFELTLKRYGADVTGAATAVRALEMLGQLEIDVLVSDIQMPLMDGYQLISRVRAMDLEATRKIPAIALTAYARAEDRMRSFLAGYQAHISKPVEPSELVATVAALAGRTGQV